MQNAVLPKLVRIARWSATALCLLLMSVNVDGSGGGALDLPSRLRGADLKRRFEAQLMDHLSGGTGDPAALCAAYADEPGSDGPTQLRLRVAAAALDPDPARARALMSDLLEYPATGEGLENRLHALSVLWTSLMGLRRMDLAADLGKRLLEAMPDSRHARRLWANALLAADAIEEAGSILAAMLEQDPLEFGYSYGYPRRDPLVAEPWVSPLGLTNLPLVQEKHQPMPPDDPARAFVVKFDLPEVEQWCRRAAVLDAAKREKLLKADAARTGPGWDYLRLRGLLHIALREGLASTPTPPDIAQRIDAAYQNLSVFLGERQAQGTSLWRYLTWRRDLAKHDMPAAVQAFAALLRGMESLRSEGRGAQGSLLAVARSRQLGDAMAQEMIEILARTPPADVQATVNTLSPLAASMLPVVLRGGLSRLKARADAAKEGDREAERAAFALALSSLGGALRGRDVFIACHDLLDAPTTSEFARAQLNAAATWHGRVMGDLFSFENLPAQRERSIAATREAQIRVVYSVNHPLVDAGVAMPDAAIAVKLTEAARAAVALSSDEGEALLQSVSKNVTGAMEPVKKQFDYYTTRGGSSDRFTEYITTLNVAWLAYRSIADAVTPEVRARVEAPDLKGLKPLPTVESIAAMLADGTPAPDAAAALANEVKSSRGMPLRLALAGATALALWENGREESGGGEYERVAAVLRETPEYGPFALRQLELELAAAWKGREALAASVMEILLRGELPAALRAARPLLSNTLDQLAKNSLYVNAQDETDYGFPRRLFAVAQERDAALLRQQMLSLYPIDNAAALTSAQELNGHAWMRHTFGVGAATARRMARLALAVGSEESASLITPTGAESGGDKKGARPELVYAELSGAAATVDTFAWAHYDGGDKASAIAWEEHALRLAPGTKVFEHTLDIFRKDKSGEEGK